MSASSEQKETRGHKQLKKKVASILERCGFNVDTEVHIRIAEDDNASESIFDRPVDVLGLIRNEGKNYIFIFECKDRNQFKGITKEASAWITDMNALVNNRRKINVVSSTKKKISSNELHEIDDIRVCYAFSKKLDNSKFINYKGIFKRANLFSWDSYITKYYDEISKILKEWTKYELFKEFDIDPECGDIKKVDAVQIKQKGNPEMFLFGLSPKTLLKICYVYRRSSGRHEAYQRLLNRDRINQISQNFTSTDKLLLPNPIIISFDNDTRIQDEVKYKPTIKKFYFPKSYCSAWIIDGQHRLYGFMDTVENYTDDEDFKIPVVAFKNLPAIVQNKTFININYYQKKINPTLLCDLSTIIKDLQFELTWPSLIGLRMNEDGPLKGVIKTSELHTGRLITLSGFARYGLLSQLLGYNVKTNQYNGPLYEFASFDPTKPFSDADNQRAFEQQIDKLNYFFTSVKEKTTNDDISLDPWRNLKDYSLLNTTGLNALLIVLNRFFRKYPNLDIDLSDKLDPISSVDFSKDHVSYVSGGWKGFNNFANEIISKININKEERI